MENEREHFINSVNLNINTDFPYLVLDVVGDKSYPRNPGFGVMHWHEDLQFIYVLNGTIEVRTLDTIVAGNLAIAQIFLRAQIYIGTGNTYMI